MLDQRGYTRDASADAGAFELGGTLPAPDNEQIVLSQYRLLLEFTMMLLLL